MENTQTTDCFLTLELVAPRAMYPVPYRYKAVLVARGTGTVLYTSKVCDTRDECRKLAVKYLVRNPQYNAKVGV